VVEAIKAVHEGFALEN